MHVDGSRHRKISALCLPIKVKEQNNTCSIFFSFHARLGDITKKKIRSIENILQEGES